MNRSQIPAQLTENRRAAAAWPCLVAFAALACSDGGAPTLYRGGPILTMDASNRVVDALAIEDGRIEAVGTSAALAQWAKQSGARIVELDGRAIVPGFIEAHGHFPGSGLSAVYADLNSPPIGSIEKIDDLIRVLADQSSEKSDDEWVVGIGYDDTLIDEKRHPTRQDLDRASTGHPIAAVHTSGHLAAVNSRALEILEYGRDTPDPEGGVIRRDAKTREPTGVLEENAMKPIEKLLTPGVIAGLKIMRRGSDIYLRSGVTTAQSGSTSPGLMQMLELSSRFGLVGPRLVLWPTPEAADEILAGERSNETYDPLWVRIGAVKFIADGSIQGYTGYLSEPYTVPPGDDPSYRGYPRIPDDELRRSLVRLHAEGLQLAIHGNGDASIDAILDALEAAQRAHPREDARHIIIHAQMTRPDQLDRMKALGAVPSFFSLHTFYWGDRHRDIFMGPERAARISPAKSALDKGVRFTIHADAPVVPYEPLRLVWSAVNRRTRSGALLGSAERISPMQALRAVTIDAAWQHFEEDVKGSLEPGKLADFVILDRSPLESPETIDHIRVLETVIGGESVYRAN